MGISNSVREARMVYGEALRLDVSHLFFCWCCRMRAAFSSLGNSVSVVWRVDGVCVRFAFVATSDLGIRFLLFVRSSPVRLVEIWMFRKCCISKLLFVNTNSV